jgi:hypothetical protein
MSNEEFTNFAQTFAQIPDEALEKAKNSVSEIAQYDKKAAKLFAAHITALTELCNHFRG